MINKLLIKIIKIILSLICFGFLYYNLDFDLIKSIIKDINYSYLTPLLIFFSVYLLIYSLFIFKIYKSLFTSKLNLISWFKIFVNGNFLNSIPFVGFIYKGYRLKSYDISIKNYLFANVFISWAAITIFFLVYSLEIFFLINPKISIFEIPVYSILISLSFFAFVSPTICVYIMDKLNINIEIFKSLFFFIQKNTFNKKIIKHFLTFGLLLHLLIFITYFFIIKLLDIPIGLQIIVVIFLISEIIDAIPIPNNNFLLTELIGGFTATFVGVAFTEFVLIKFVFRIFNLIIVIPTFIIINILSKSEL
jgi:hypothetical protein